MLLKKGVQPSSSPPPPSSSDTAVTCESSTCVHASCGGSDENASLPEALPPSTFGKMAPHMSLGSHGSSHHRSTTTNTTSRQSYYAPLTLSGVTAEARKRLDEMTIDKLRFHKIGVVGRDQEIQRLQHLFRENHASSQRYRRLVLIGGTAGTGKSHLARWTFAPLVQRVRGFLLAGKHDQQKGDIPYVAIASCCEGFCQQVIAERSVEDVNKLKRTLRTELGEEGQVLTATIPSLIPLIGVSATSTETTNQTQPTNLLNASRQFVHAFQRFIRIACSLFGPLVFLIDDLQWCDDSSFLLLRKLLKDTDNSQLFIVGTYRCDEIDRGALFQSLDVKPENNCTTTLSIEIGNLSVEATAAMLTELLSREEKDVLALAALLHKKTSGNAFFMVQFLTSLQQRKLLQFSFGTMSWTWDVDEIDLKTVATDNVADLVKARMEELPPHLHQLLPYVGSLGSIFTIDLISTVVQHVNSKKLESSTEETLLTCSNVTDIFKAWEEKGLIEHVSENVYRWIHDKVQEAALSLVPLEQLASMQFNLAIDLVGRMDKKDLYENIFVLTYLFRTAPTKLERQDPTRHIIAKLHLDAGRKAFKQSAFGHGAEELEAGIALLSPESWQSNYQLCLDLYSEAAETNLCIGQHDSMNRHINAVVENTRGQPLLDRRRVYNAKALGLHANGQIQEAASWILKVLAELGVKFPGLARGTLMFVWKLLQVKKKAKVICEKVQNLPLAKNQKEKWILFLLSELRVVWYTAHNPLMTLCVLKEMEYTLDFGNNETTPHCLASLGVVCAFGLDDAETGSVFAKAALSLLHKTHKSSEAYTLFVCYHLNLHFSQPVQDFKKELLRGYYSGLEHGDITNACWCILCFLDEAMVSGAVLDSLVKDCRIYTKKVAGELQQALPGSIMTLIWQSAMNLSGMSDDPLVLTGEAMSEESWLQLYPDWKLYLTKFHIHIAVILGAHDVAMRGILKNGCDPVTQEKSAPGYYSFYWLYFHSAIAAVSMARKTNQFHFYLKMARKYGRKIQTWAKQGSPNYLHQAELLSAEMADLDGRTEEANKHFQASLLQSARRGFRVDRAMTHERYGDFHLRQNDPVSARFQYDQAILVYKEWGGQAKVEQLQNLHSKLLSQ